MAGFINDTAGFYEGLDLYLNTSIHEGIPMSILEAMAKGIPVVAPDVGGIREIIEDGIHGYLVKDRDPKSFCDKCIKIYEDRGLQKIMGVAARERVIERFSLVSMVKNYHNLYLGG